MSENDVFPDYQDYDTPFPYERHEYGLYSSTGGNRSQNQNSHQHQRAQASRALQLYPGTAASLAAYVPYYENSTPHERLDPGSYSMAGRNPSQYEGTLTSSASRFTPVTVAYETPFIPYEQFDHGSYSMADGSSQNLSRYQYQTMASHDMGLSFTNEPLSYHNYETPTSYERHDFGLYSTAGGSLSQNLNSHQYEGYVTSNALQLTQGNQTKHRKQTLSIVDPSTGKDVIREIEIDKALAKLAKPEVKEDYGESNRIAAEFAALVAAKLYPTEVDSKQTPDSRKTMRNAQSHFGMLPKEILNMDSRSIELYNKALQEGEDTTHNIRLMIVGHYGVGKTTLKKRLFRETVDIQERKSTDGIDVHVGRCKVSLKDGTWLTGHKQTDGSRKSLRRRIAQLMCNTNEEEQAVQGIFKCVDIAPNVSATHTDSTPVSAGDILRETSSQADTTDIRNDDFIRQKIHLEELVKEMQHDLFIKDDEHCDLSLWDFAGQNIFYATHQAFLSRKAVYLLVIDLSKHIDDTVHDDIWHFDCQGEKRCKVTEFIEFWLNSIHEFCSFPGESGPPVILVGTFIDKLKQRSDADRCFYNVRSFLVGKVTNSHLTEKHFHVDNTIEGDKNIDALREYIVEVASEQRNWGERIPAKWITLEERLVHLREEKNVKVIQKETLREENRLLPVPIESEDELELFLKFHHETGTILYFGEDDLKDEILLDPQWLIDAFKSLITAASFCIGKAEIQKKWHEFARSAVLTHDLIELILSKDENSLYLTHKELIMKFMEKLGFVAKPKQCTDDSTLSEDYCLVPCMLKDPPPAKIIAWNDSQQIKSTSKLCFTNAEEPDKRFISSTAFNKFIAACINQWPLSIQNEKYMIFCGGAVFQLRNNHFLYIFLYEHVIQIWISRLSMEGQKPAITLCRTTQEQLRNILEENVRMRSKILSLVKCPRATLYSNGNMAILQVDGNIQNREIPCYCQDKEHVVSYVDISQYWLPEDRIPVVVPALHLDLEKKPTEKDFSRISRRIGKEFKQVAFELGLSKPDIDHICMDNKTSADKITAVLCKWSKRMGEKATYGELVKTLQGVGVDVASVFRT